VKFSIRVHFRDDFAYIDFGCPWELVDKGTIDDESDATDFIENFVLLHCHFISKEDALQILDEMFAKTSENTAVYAIMRNAPQIVTETTELVDEDGSIIAL
jgi:putative heme degradation protein